MSKFKVSSSKSSILSYPTAKPELSLDFVNTPEGIDPAYTFTRNSSATYVGPDGLIKTAAVNQPRFDFDPVTGECKGLLIEESNQNRLLHSENFSNSYWTKNNVSVIQNIITSPSNTLTGTKLIENNLNAVHELTASGGGLGRGGATYIAISIFAKAAERQYCYIRSSGNTKRIAVVVDLSNGNFEQRLDGNVADRLSTVTKYPNGWYKITCRGRSNFPNAEGWGGNFNVSPLNIYASPADVAASGFSYAGDGTSGIYIWGAHYEHNSFISSYIPTTTTTVTRQPDQLVLNKPLSTQGTLYVESRPTTGTPLVADNGSSPLAVSQEPNQYSKSVLLYNTNRILRMSSDGNVPEDYSSSSSSSNLNRVSLGFDRLNNTNYINGHLKKFSYYSSPLTEDNLRALTGNKRSIFRFSDEPIVTSGLVLNLDAGNPASYPGSGTTWFDLSGNGNNGTLVNVVRYSYKRWC